MKALARCNWWVVALGFGVCVAGELAKQAGFPAGGALKIVGCGLVLWAATPAISGSERES